MFNRSSGVSIPHLSSASSAAFWLILVNLAFNVLANASFRISALSESWRGITSPGRWSGPVGAAWI